MCASLSFTQQIMMRLSLKQFVLICCARVELADFLARALLWLNDLAGKVCTHAYAHTHPHKHPHKHTHCVWVTSIRMRRRTCVYVFVYVFTTVGRACGAMTASGSRSAGRGPEQRTTRTTTTTTTTFPVEGSNATTAAAAACVARASRLLCACRGVEESLLKILRGGWCKAQRTYIDIDIARAANCWEKLGS